MPQHITYTGNLIFYLTHSHFQQQGFFLLLFCCFFFSPIDNYIIVTELLCGSAIEFGLSIFNLSCTTKLSDFGTGLRHKHHLFFSCMFIHTSQIFKSTPERAIETKVANHLETIYNFCNKRSEKILFKDNLVLTSLLKG